MATEAEQTEGSPRDGGGDGPRSRGEGSNRIAWGVMVTLVVLLAIAGIIGGIKAKKTTQNVNLGSRLVVVPTDDASRTVIVTPCQTGAKVTSKNPAAAIGTTGASAIVLPQGTGTRLVTVPPCDAATSGVPSAAFVARPGIPVPPVNPTASSSSSNSASSSSSSSSNSSASSSPQSQIANPQGVLSQLIVPASSTIRTIEVQPCEQIKIPPQALLSAAAGSTTAVAPPC